MFHLRHACHLQPINGIRCNTAFNPWHFTNWSRKGEHCFIFPANCLDFVTFYFFHSRKTLKSAKKSHDTHQAEIKELEEELQAVQKKQEEWESQLAEESQSQGRDMTLEESQVCVFFK